MYGINYNEDFKIKHQFIIPDFLLYAIFNLQCKFLYAGTICIPMGKISIPLEMFSVPAGAKCTLTGTICIPAGTIGNQIPMGDMCLWIYLQEYIFTQTRIFTHRVNFYPMATYFHHSNRCLATFGNRWLAKWEMVTNNLTVVIEVVLINVALWESSLYVLPTKTRQIWHCILKCDE